MSVLIFEGPDRVGKTTIANAVAKKLGTEVFMTNSKESFTDKSVFSEDSSPVAMFNYYIAKYLSELKNAEVNSKPVVIYRSFLSEMVYSDLLGRETSQLFNKATDNLFQQMNATIVFLHNDKRSDFEDDTLNDDQVLRSTRLYHRHMSRVDTDIIEINTTEQDVDSYVDSIIAYMRSKERVFK